jgi:hypothetical protein
MIKYNPPSSAEFKYEQELYLLSPLVPPWHIAGTAYNPQYCSFPVIRIVKNKDLINISYFQFKVLMYAKSKSSIVVLGTVYRNGILKITGIHSEVFFLGNLKLIL